MPSWTIVLIVVSALLVVAALCVLLYLFALPRFIVGKMRKSDGDGQMSFPDDFESIQEKTEKIKDLIYPSAYPSNKYNIYLPSQRQPNNKYPLIIWVHGGGFIAGSKDGGDNVMVSLCAAGYAVASIDYAVAPEYKYPTAVLQVAEFCAHLPKIFDSYPCIDGSRIAFGGDSAGAQIAAQYVATQYNSSLAEKMGITISLNNCIKAIVLVCGPFNLPGIRAYAKKTNKMFCRLVDIWGRAYFGKLRWYKSLNAAQTVIVDNLSDNFPATFLTDGNKGSFEAQNRKLAEVLKSKNIAVDELYFDAEKGDVPHEYLFQLGESNAQIGLERILLFLQNYL